MTTERAIPDRVRPARAATAIAAACLLAALAALAYRAVAPAVVFEGDSAFGGVRVVEHRDGLRSLYIGAGRARQSAIHPGRPLHLEFAYTRVGMIGLALTPPDGRILFVGLGGGAMPMYTRQVRPDAHIDIVEIDPLIVDVAQRFFGFRPDPRMVVHTGDGRAFLEAAPAATYDLIVLDAFSDDEIPAALTTREFLETVRTRLVPGGVVVSNLWTRNDAYAAMVATYDAVFDQVHRLRVLARAQHILIAGSHARQLDRTALARAARDLGASVHLGFDLERLVTAGYETARPRSAPLLRDAALAPGAQ